MMHSKIDRLVLVATVCAAAIAQSACAATGDPLPADAVSARKLTFKDEFDGRTVDRGRWSFGISRFPDFIQTRTLYVNREQGWYLGDGFAGTDARSFSFDRGTMAITAQPLSAHDRTITRQLVDRLNDPRIKPADKDVMRRIDYSTGLLSSGPRKTFRYGYFETRMAMPQGKGWWPAFWLMSPFGNGEIDAIEWVGKPDMYHANVHGQSVGNLPSVAIPLSDPQAFHAYGVLWNATEIVWYLDRREAHRMPTPTDLRQPLMIHLGMAVGGGWAGPPAAGSTGQLRVDYVRVWKP